MVRPLLALKSFGDFLRWMVSFFMVLVHWATVTSDEPVSVSCLLNAVVSMFSDNDISCLTPVRILLNLKTISQNKAKGIKIIGFYRDYVFLYANLT